MNERPTRSATTLLLLAMKRLMIEASSNKIMKLQEMKQRKIHASEWAWIGTEFVIELDNNGSIDDLFIRLFE